MTCLSVCLLVHLKLYLDLAKVSASVDVHLVRTILNKERHGGLRDQKRG